MSTDEIPPVPQYNRPRTRPSTGPAWRAGWLLLSDGDPRSRTDVIAAMREANPISYRTARQVLSQAVTDGLLEVVSRDHVGRPTLRRKR